MAEFRIETGQLVLREWRDTDVARVFAMGQDPQVMAFLGPLMTMADAERLVAGQMRNQELFGHCFWPVERRSDGAFLGLCGVQKGPAGTPIDGRIEIGWRLLREAWGKGYAREAAQAALAWTWANLPAEDVYAMTVVANRGSWGLMERLGMARRGDLDFDHPALAPGDPLRAHIVYSIARPL